MPWQHNGVGNFGLLASTLGDFPCKINSVPNNVQDFLCRLMEKFKSTRWITKGIESVISCLPALLVGVDRIKLEKNWLTSPQFT